MYRKEIWSIEWKVLGAFELQERVLKAGGIVPSLRDCLDKEEAETLVTTYARDLDMETKTVLDVCGQCPLCRPQWKLLFSMELSLSHSMEAADHKTSVFLFLRPSAIGKMYCNGKRCAIFRK